MPGFGWGLSATLCKRGSQLAAVPGTACSRCYARKGRYRFPSVIAAHERRLAGLSDPRWPFAMAMMIAHHTTMAVPYFRWFDSGDLQSPEHLAQIIQVCKMLPDIRFWLPTQEWEMVRKVTLPKNLVVRLSDSWVSDEFFTKRESGNSSQVAPRSFKAKWPQMVKRNSKKTYFCPSPLQNNTCDKCRACWKKEIRHIVYLEH